MIDKVTSNAIHVLRMRTFGIIARLGRTGNNVVVGFLSGLKKPSHTIKSSPLLRKSLFMAIDAFNFG
jgi:hypothetical protein